MGKFQNTVRCKITSFPVLQDHLCLSCRKHPVSYLQVWQSHGLNFSGHAWVTIKPPRELSFTHLLPCLHQWGFSGAYNLTTRLWTWACWRWKEALLDQDQILVTLHLPGKGRKYVREKTKQVLKSENLYSDCRNLVLSQALTLFGS